jgi:hypothetical protein
MKLIENIDNNKNLKGAFQSEKLRPYEEGTA